jgi:hypothetical protein
VRPLGREHSEHNAAADLLFIWKGEQRFALRGGQEFMAWHATILITNSVFENCDRSDFRDSMTSLILDAGTGSPRQIPSSRYNSAEDSLRLFKSLAYVNFRYAEFLNIPSVGWELASCLRFIGKNSEY